MILLTLSACLDHDPPPGGTETFVAMQADFYDFRGWNAVEVEQTDSGHPAGDRVVYINQAATDGFAVGTILVKTIATDAGTDIHAMAKRGGGFNADGAVGWEWFELVTADDGTPVILWRGGAPPDGEAYGQLPGQTADTGAPEGDCNVCHSAVAAKDYVHTEGL